MIGVVDRAAGELHKRAENADEADRLHHEATVLAVARHPGVVHVLGGSGDVLRLALVDGATLSDIGAVPDEDLAPIAIAAATTLADLHDIGVVHGALSAEHILINATGAPILCSFGRGATGCLAGGAPARSDVAALALALLPLASPGAPAHRVLAAAAGGGNHAFPARRLATLLASPPQPRIPGRFGTGRARPRAVPVVAAGLVVVAVAVARATAHPGGGPPSPAPQAATTATATTATTVATTACPEVDRGCRPLARPDGIIETATGRYRIGQPGDLVVLGRWRCHAAFPALLRPATGEVWVWDAWPGPTAPQPAHLVTRVPGAKGLQVAPGPSRCDALRVLDPGGAVITIRPDQPA